MTTTVHTVQLVCDSCGVRRQGRIGQTVFGLRLGLSAVGWRCDDERNRDRCPTCVDNVQTAVTAAPRDRHSAKDRSHSTKPGGRS